MLVNALLNELFNVFPNLFHVKEGVWAMLSFVFAYAKTRVSHNEAHIILWRTY